MYESIYEIVHLMIADLLLDTIICRRTHAAGLFMGTNGKGICKYANTGVVKSD